MFSLSDDADTKNAAEEIGGPVALEVFIFIFGDYFVRLNLCEISLNISRHAIVFNFKGLHWYYFLHNFR